MRYRELFKTNRSLEPGDKLTMRIQGKWTCWVIKDSEGKIKEAYGRNFHPKPTKKGRKKKSE